MGKLPKYNPEAWAFRRQMEADMKRSEEEEVRAKYKGERFLWCRDCQRVYPIERWPSMEARCPTWRCRGVTWITARPWSLLVEIEGYPETPKIGGEYGSWIA